MARALRLAARGIYAAHPNPMVGCVLVRDGEIVGEGWHEAAGEAHAEINALIAAGDAAAGASDDGLSIDVIALDEALKRLLETLEETGVLLAAPRPGVVGARRPTETERSASLR